MLKNFPLTHLCSTDLPHGVVNMVTDFSHGGAISDPGLYILVEDIFMGRIFD